jgi:hypothetical protein
MKNFIKMKKYNQSGKKMYIDEENIYFRIQRGENRRAQKWSLGFKISIVSIDKEHIYFRRSKGQNSLLKLKNGIWVSKSV